METLPDLPPGLHPSFTWESSRPKATATRVYKGQVTIHCECTDGCAYWTHRPHQEKLKDYCYCTSKNQKSSRHSSLLMAFHQSEFEEFERSGDKWCPFALGGKGMNGGCIVMGDKETITTIQDQSLQLFRNLSSTADGRAKVKRRDFHETIYLRAHHIEEDMKFWDDHLDCWKHPGKKLSHCGTCRLHQGWSLKMCRRLLSTTKGGDVHLLAIVERASASGTGRWKHNDVNIPYGKWRPTLLDDEDELVVETHAETSLRELFEESGIRLTEKQLRLWCKRYRQTVNTNVRTPNVNAFGVFLPPINELEIAMTNLHSIAEIGIELYKRRPMIPAPRMIRALTDSEMSFISTFSEGKEPEPTTPHTRMTPEDELALARMSETALAITDHVLAPPPPPKTMVTATTTAAATSPPDSIIMVGEVPLVIPADSSSVTILKTATVGVTV